MNVAQVSCTPGRDDMEDMLPTSQSESYIGITDESISSMDIDLGMLEKEVGHISAPSVSMTHSSSGTMPHGATASSPVSPSASSSPLPRPVGPGIGKPSFGGKKFGKKITSGTGRPRVNMYYLITVNG